MKISFIPRNRPLYPELRICYKMTEILLILFINSRGGKSSLIRLHLFNWGINDPKNRTLLLKFSQNNQIDLTMWSVDPMLNSAIEFAVAENLISRESIMYTITEKGKKYVEEIKKIDEYKREIQFLEMIGKNITEKNVSQQMDLWR